MPKAIYEAGKLARWTHARDVEVGRGGAKGPATAARWGEWSSRELDWHVSSHPEEDSGEQKVNYESLRDER